MSLVAEAAIVDSGAMGVVGVLVLRLRLGFAMDGLSLGRKR